MTNLVSRLKLDRRSAPRYPIRVPIRYRMRKPSALEHHAHSDNVSEVGIFFASREPVAVGAAIDLLFEVPEVINESSTAGQYLCTGRVVRVTPAGKDSCGVGVQFFCFDALHAERFTERKEVLTGSAT